MDREIRGSQTFIPYVVEDEQAGIVAIGLRCSGCNISYDSADIMMDSLMFKKATIHVCPTALSSRIHGSETNSGDPLYNLTLSSMYSSLHRR